MFTSLPRGHVILNGLSRAFFHLSPFHHYPSLPPSQLAGFFPPPATVRLPPCQRGPRVGPTVLTGARGPALPPSSLSHAPCPRPTCKFVCFWFLSLIGVSLTFKQHTPQCVCMCANTCNPPPQTRHCTQPPPLKIPCVLLFRYVCLFGKNTYHEIYH